MERLTAKGHTRVMLSGHSFLKRLENRNNLIPRDPFTFHGEEFLIQFAAHSGCNLESLRFHLGNDMPKQSGKKTNIVYLEIGSNDLCRSANTPAVVAKKIYDLARYLHFDHGVQKVVIGQILQRLFRHTRHFSLLIYL